MTESEEVSPAPPKAVPPRAAAPKVGAPKAASKPQAARPTGAKPPAGAAAPTAATGGGTAASGALKFVVTKFAPVYLATWQGEQDTCTICRSLFVSPCVNCEVNGATEACPYQEGQCGHMFHMHCIERWLVQDKTCPLCHDQWAVKI
jgi:RING-box protein 1